MSNTVVMRGFGPHIRFKTAQNVNGTQVRVVTNTAVRTVPLTETKTDLTFKAA